MQEVAQRIEVLGIEDQRIMGQQIRWQLYL